MNTKQKMTLLGVIVTLILVTAIVIVILVMSNQITTKTLTRKPETTPNPKMTSEEVVAEYQRLMKAVDLPRIVFIKARFGLKDKNDAVVQKPTLADWWALKTVELYGCEEYDGTDLSNYESAKKIEAMLPIGKKMMIGNPIYTPKGPKHLSPGGSFFELFKEDQSVCNLWLKMTRDDGEHSLYYFRRNRLSI